MPADAERQAESRKLREALILDLARSRPGFARELSGDIREAERSSPTCGDRIRVRAHLLNGAVADVGWDGRGCAVSTASAGALSRVVPGTPLVELAGMLDRVREVVGPGGSVPAEGVGDMELFAGIGRLPLRGRCALLAWEALADAVRDAVTDEDQPSKWRAS